MNKYWLDPSKVISVQVHDLSLTKGVCVVIVGFENGQCLEIETGRNESDSVYNSIVDAIEKSRGKK